MSPTKPTITSTSTTSTTPAAPPAIPTLIATFDQLDQLTRFFRSFPVISLQGAISSSTLDPVPSLVTTLRQAKAGLQSYQQAHKVQKSLKYFGSPLPLRPVHLMNFLCIYFFSSP